VLLRNGTAGSWAGLRALLAKDALLETFGGLRVEVGAAPYSEAAAKRILLLSEYAEAVAAAPSELELLPVQTDEGGRRPRADGGGLSMSRDYLFVGLYAASEPMHGALKARLEAHSPPVLTESLERRHLYYRASTQFSLGPPGSGSPLHYHMAAVNTLVFGRKRWTLLPPRDAVYSALPVFEWHRAGGVEALRREGRTALECTQRAGDVLYVPDHWGHAVLNLQTSVGFATEVATARGHSMRMELSKSNS